MESRQAAVPEGVHRPRGPLRPARRFCEDLSRGLRAGQPAVERYPRRRGACSRPRLRAGSQLAGNGSALRKPSEYERFTGRMAKRWTEEPVEEMKFFEGRLAGVADCKVRVELKGKIPRIVELPLSLIRKANLVVEF